MTYTTNRHAAIATFLVPAQSYITGATLQIEGGLLRSFR
jgi:hypothetical protein